MKIPGFLNKLFSNNDPQPTFPLVWQRIPAECGTASLCMVLAYLGSFYSLDEMNELLKPDPERGSSLHDLQQAAEQAGYTADAFSLDFNDFTSDKRIMPVIIYWEAGHFAVAYRTEKDQVWVADPARGYVKYNREEFCAGWYCDPEREDRGVILLIE